MGGEEARRAIATTEFADLGSTGQNVVARIIRIGAETISGAQAGPAVCWVLNNACPTCATPLNIIGDAKIATIHTIVLRDRKAAIVLTAVKGKALARRPDGRPGPAAACDGGATLGRDEGMVRALTEQRNGRRLAVWRQDQSSSSLQGGLPVRRSRALPAPRNNARRGNRLTASS